MAVRDPRQELEEIFLEVETLETNLRRCVEITSFILDKNKELLAENERS